MLEAGGGGSGGGGDSGGGGGRGGGESGGGGGGGDIARGGATLLASPPPPPQAAKLNVELRPKSAPKAWRRVPCPMRGVERASVLAADSPLTVSDGTIEAARSRSSLLTATIP